MYKKQLMQILQLELYVLMTVYRYPQKIILNKFELRSMEMLLFSPTSLKEYFKKVD